MEFDYFYGQQSEQFSFYRIPKMLFTDDRFWNVSTDAKLLYGILLDRMNLSARNGWMDAAGRVYIIFTLEETMAALNCGDNKATKLYNELEKKCGLIERKRQGLGKPNLIYVKNFVSGVDSIVESRFKSRENHDSGVGQNPILESGKPRGNNTDTIYTDYSDTDPILSSGFCGKGTEGSGDWEQYYDYFREQLEFDILLSRYPYDHNLLKTILDLIVETVCTRRKLIRIASDDKPAEIVKSRFMKLESDHVCFVIDWFKENKTDVRNVKQYLLAAIYNAPMTIDPYYDAKVRHDMLVVQDQVWGRVTTNRNAGKATRYYMDEFHLLLKEEQTASYSVEIWKRFRKWGGIPTGITQNVKDMLRSPEIANILENSDFIYMLNQASDDRNILAQRLNISPHQLSYVTNSGEGEGLLFYGNVILPFVDRFPTDLELYRIMTTKLSEVQDEKEA